MGWGGVRWDGEECAYGCGGWGGSNVWGLEGQGMAS